MWCTCRICSSSNIIYQDILLIILFFFADRMRNLGYFGPKRPPIEKMDVMDIIWRKLRTVVLCIEHTVSRTWNPPSLDLRTRGKRSQVRQPRKNNCYDVVKPRIVPKDKRQRTQQWRQCLQKFSALWKPEIVTRAVLFLVNHKWLTGLNSATNVTKRCHQLIYLGK